MVNLMFFCSLLHDEKTTRVDNIAMGKKKLRISNIIRQLISSSQEF